MPSSATRFKKGQSGNPSGRPKAAVNLRELLKKRYGEDGRLLIDRMEALSVCRYRKIALAATETLLAYLVGKPVSQHELTGLDGQPMGVRITFGGRYRPDDGTPS